MRSHATQLDDEVSQDDGVATTGPSERNRQSMLQQRQSNVSPLWVFPVIFGSMHNFGLIRPSLPTITLDFFDASYSRSAIATGVTDAMGALLAFLVMPLLGEWSDKYGRRPLLLLTLTFTSLPIWSLCLYPDYASLWLFYAAQVLSKLSCYSCVYSYVADTTSPELRAGKYGQVSACVFFALSIGPLLASEFEMHKSFLLAGIFSACNILYTMLMVPESLNFHLAKRNMKQQEEMQQQADQHRPNQVTALSASRSCSLDSPTERSALILRIDSIQAVQAATSVSSDRDVTCDSCHSESSSPSERSATARGRSDGSLVDLQPSRQTDGAMTSPSQADIKSNANSNYLSSFATLRFMFRSPLYTLVFTMVLLEQLSIYGLGEIFLLFLMRELQFTRTDNIRLSLIGGCCTCVVMVLLLPWATRRVGEKKIICVSIFAHAVYCAIYPFVGSCQQVYMLISLSAVSAMAYPATGALVSRIVPQHEQGISQGALAGIRSISLGCGPLVFSLLFALTTMESIPSYLQFAAAPFVLGALLSCAALWCAMQIPDDDELEVDQSNQEEQMDEATSQHQRAPS